MEPLEPVRIYPQRCYDCQVILKKGDSAFAHVQAPVAFCVKCARDKQKALLAVAVVAE